MPAPIRSENRSYIGGSLPIFAPFGIDRRKGCEVFFADDQRCPARHGLFIQRIRIVPYVSSQEWRTNRPAIDPVAICFRLSGMAGMKLRGHLANREHSYRSRKYVVQSLHKILSRDGRLRDKCHNLSQGMNSRVSATGALGQYFFARKPSNG